MAYDAHGRSRGNEDPSHLESNGSNTHDSSQYPTEPQDKPSMGRRASSNASPRTSSPIDDKMASAPDRAEPLGHDGVSPELIAAITEKVKKESAYSKVKKGPILVPC